MVPTDDGNVTEWDEVTRRYRRGPGGWWWLALLLVPLLLALLGLGLGGGDDDEDPVAPTGSGSTDSGAATDGAATSDDADAATTSDDADATTAGDGAATTDAPDGDAGTLPGPFSVTRDGDAVTVSAEVPDETSKAALVGALQARLGDGVEVIDEVTVVPDATIPDPMALGGLLDAGADLPDFGLDWDGADALTLTGTAPAEDVRSSIETAAATVVPTATIDNQITVDPAAGTGDDDAAGEGCATLGTESATLLTDSPITFQTGGAELTDASRLVIGDLVPLIEGCEGATIEVSGHTDNTGRASFNDQLSDDRARAVVDALVAEGVTEGRLTAKGYGSDEPIESNDTEAGREANRRVEILIVEGER